MKHIESIQPEYAAEELERIVREEGDATASAALTALLHNVTGCAIPPLADHPESEVEELVPLCLSILRRHWTTPLTALGDGTTPISLADLLRRLILGRVDGNEALGISPANADITTAVSALTKRHIDDGLTLTLPDGDGSPDGSPTTSPSALPTSLPDGLSLAQLLCGVSPDGTDLASSVTELQDSNKGWTMSKAFANGFPNAKKVTLCCKTLHASPSSMFPNAEEFDFPCLDHIDTGESGHPQINIFYGAHIKRINMPEVTQLRVVNASYMGLFYNITSPCEILTPKCTSVVSAFDNNYPRLFHSTPGVYKWVLGKITNANNLMTNGDFVNLIHFEIGEGTAVSLNLKYWTATNVLSKPEFLSNFKTYIADRVADRTGKTALTITLSPEVYAALEAQEGQTILATLTNKNWTVASA